MYTVFAIDEQRVDRSYLVRFLKSPRALAHYPQLGKGAVHRRKAISLSALGSLVVPLPTLDEQRRIATILDHADVLRAKRSRVLAHLETLTQSIFHDMFSSDRATMPLGESLTFVTSGGRGWAKYYSKIGDRFIRSLDVQMGTIGNRDPVFVTPPENAEARRTRTQEGDVLLTITGSRIGRVAALPSALAGAFISQHVAILRLDTGQLRPDFVAAMLASPELGQRLIARAQYGQTKPGLNFEQIRSFDLPRPPIHLQVEFARRIEAVADQRAVVLDAQAAEEELFDSLHSRAFRGEL